MKKPIFLLFFIFISKALIARPQDQITITDTIYSKALSEVVVTANRYNTLGINTPEAIRVLNSATVNDYQIRTAPEALILSPGVFVQKTNHGGGSPFIRGLTGNQTLMLIDGIRLNNSVVRYGPNQYFNTIDVYSTDRMEILRGSGSVQYGSDALGGTIQVFSRELGRTEQPEWSGNILGRITTGGMEKSLRSGLAYTGSQAAFTSGITWRDFGDVIGGDTTGRQTPSGYKEFDYDMKGSLTLSPTATITALYQNVNQSDIPVYHKILLENYAVNKTDPQKRQLAYLRLNKEFNTGFIKSAFLTASYQISGEGRESRKNGSDILRKETDRIRTLGFSAEAHLSWKKGWSGNTGIDFYNDLVNSRRNDMDLVTNSGTDKRGLYPDGSSMTSMAVFSVHSFENDKWNITAGGRFNSFIINVNDEELGKVRLSPSALVGNFGVMRKIGMNSGLFVSLNTGFRAPNIDDLGTLGIVDFRYETPDYNLKPERSFQYQAGYKYSGSRLKGDLFVYRNELTDIITRNRVGDETIEGYPLYMKENSERAFIEGAETAWDYSVSGKITLYGALTYTYGQNITKNEPVRRIPPLFGRLAVDFRQDNLLLGLEWLAAGKQDRLAQGDIDDNRIPDGGTPGWNIINLKSAFNWKILTIDICLNNLLNKDYRYHGSGINGYGRSLLMTLQFMI